VLARDRTGNVNAVRSFARLLLLAAVSLTAISLCAAPADAVGSLYSRVLHAYQANGGTVPPCEFTSKQLESVVAGADTYENQYLADFPNAIDEALSQRASGACSHTISSQSAAISHARPGPPLRPGPVTAATGAPVPAPIVLLAVIGGVLLAVLGVGWVARSRGWDPPWAATWRHAWAEAEYRAGAGWANVVDRLRRD
jgi:hypothetical protein